MFYSQVYVAEKIIYAKSSVINYAVMYTLFSLRVILTAIKTFPDPVSMFTY